MGHVFGLGHDAGGPMPEMLDPGVRRSPTPGEAAPPATGDARFALLADSCAQEVLLGRMHVRPFA